MYPSLTIFLVGIDRPEEILKGVRKNLGTTGNVDFFGHELSIEADAYPEIVIPELNILRKAVFDKKAEHNLSTAQAVAVVLSDLDVDKGECWLNRGSYSYPSFDYKVDETQAIEVDLDRE